MKKIKFSFALRPLKINKFLPPPLTRYYFNFFTVFINSLLVKSNFKIRTKYVFDFTTLSIRLINLENEINFKVNHL